ncbi:MAG: cell division protein FtsL [Gammaproteobacteria bacterium]|nr:cell division protein FtsL [Gammaproteobacteria bacterium]NND39215.1 cell division protein FtsL [Pseudomonadales bacterium]MBT8151771.1 cell division protein FtsL [Gammaproteobacteria bacterium]NNL10170.1 cell division protein FtsL [Pseudomonadales bacterium]NNM11679.1 cell division protein FtsL [Pseudomonadales bacterium]
MKITLTPQQRVGLLVLLAITVLCSAIAVAYSGYMNRQSFIALKRSLADYSELQITFGKLQLEKSSWTSPVVVQAEAEKKLNMRLPPAGQTVVIVSPLGFDSSDEELVGSRATASSLR